MFHIQQINKNMLFYRINRNVFLGKKFMLKIVIFVVLSMHLLLKPVKRNYCKVTPASNVQLSKLSHHIFKIFPPQADNHI